MLIICVYIVFATLTFYNFSSVSHLRALEAVVLGSGSKFVPFISKKLLDLVSKSLVCPNRNEREAASEAVAALVDATRITTVAALVDVTRMQTDEKLAALPGTGIEN